MNLDFVRAKLKDPELFEEIVTRCVQAGLVKGEHMSVDGSFVQANADHHSRVPSEQLAEVAKVNRMVREYLAEVERKSQFVKPYRKSNKNDFKDAEAIAEAVRKENMRFAQHQDPGTAASKPLAARRWTIHYRKLTQDLSQNRKLTQDLSQSDS